METIKWIVTPSCRECDGPREFMKRNCCMGCEKLFGKKPEPVIYKRHRLTGLEREARNERILAMRKAGLSYGKIALTLKIPRATVQSVVAAASGKRQSRSLN